jgi:transcription elongation factor Elf1
MVVKVGRFGKFLACPNYPACKTTKPYVVETEGFCPECGGKMISKKSKRGYTFYGCSNYPECKFMTWDMPTGEPCPQCGKSLVIDYRGAGLEIACSQCGASVLVPIPDGMELTDLDLDSGEILKQLFATRRNYQKVELQVKELRTRLAQLQETLGVMQEVVAEGLS